MKNLQLNSGNVIIELHKIWPGVNWHWINSITFMEVKHYFSQSTSSGVQIALKP